MRVICDLHLHSRHSFATSRALGLPELAHAGRHKGVDLLAAPDWTHPTWLQELRAALHETQPGSGIFAAHGAHFMLVTEASCVWRQDGSARRVHVLITAPGFDAVDRICTEFGMVQDLASDGRPTLKLSPREVLGIAKGADPGCELIPAHVFTPWYGLFGSKTGFDRLADVFGSDSDEIFALESGLSADPAMMAPIADCATRTVVSFSDAHSARNVAREATLVRTRELTYDAVIDALRNRSKVETLELHPELGKYHLDGHRRCEVRFLPDQSVAHGNICPKCGKALTLGVLHRTRELAQLAGASPREARNAARQRFRHIVPLLNVVAHAYDLKPRSRDAYQLLEQLVEKFGTELGVLLDVPRWRLNRWLPHHRSGVRDAVSALRRGKFAVDPGYDGVYGSVYLKSPPDGRYYHAVGYRGLGGPTVRVGPRPVAHGRVEMKPESRD